SKSLGIADGDGGLTFRTLRNRSLNQGPLGLDRTHQIISSGTYSLPLGPGRAFLGKAPGVLQRLVENWQLAGILNWVSGAPLTLTTGATATTGRSSFNSGSEAPMIAGALPKSAGKAVVTSIPGVVSYFNGFAQVNDPARAGVTTANTLNLSNSEFAINDAS